MIYVYIIGMCVYTCIYIYIYIHMYIHTYIYIYMHTCIKETYHLMSYRYIHVTCAVAILFVKLYYICYSYRIHVLYKW